ncbi:MAG TPA: 50S ribosomal protein L24 [Mycobacteriales bacterium]|jgi:large subunit ribosomal protein L24|nr:50S ribosomal protein L24 [Mycobacteriales bacterium]
MHVKKGDTVKVLSGKDRGLQGKIITSFPDREKVLVEGVNRIKRHTKVTQTSRGAQTGGIVTQEAPVHVSNVQLVCPECGKPSRTGHRKDDAGRSVRVCKRCGKDV